MASNKPRVTRSSTAMRELTHGGLNNWLHRHRRAILGVVKKDGLVRSWGPFIKMMEAEGVTRPSGKPLTPAAVATAWFAVVTALERDEKAKASAPAKKVVRRRGPNLGPPSRPPPPDAGIRFPSALTVETPGWRERHPETYRPAVQPVADHAGQTRDQRSPDTPLSGAEKLARIERQFREIDGPQPQTTIKGKVV